MIKILIGGSPCTHWSIAQSKNRETTAEGQGWELFRNYLIAKEKFQPDFFLYENNKSAAQAIKDQISHELGAPLQYINSGLVSAQNRQRFYCHNFGDVPQPEDRGILLQDILESGMAWRGKGYALKAQYHCGVPDDDMLKRRQNTQVAEPIGLPVDYQPHKNSDIVTTGNSIRCQRRDAKHSTIQGTHVTLPTGKTQTLTAAHRPMAIEPIRVGTLPNGAGEVKGGQAQRIYSTNGKSVTVKATDGGGAATGLYAMPLGSTVDGKAYGLKANYGKSSTANFMNGGGHFPQSGVIEPVAVADREKAECLRATYDKCGRRNFEENIIRSKGYEGIPVLTSPMDGTAVSEYVERGKTRYPVYAVSAGRITIRGKEYPIRLTDGYYIIRKLTVTECCRLQTLPDDYCRAVSETQAYRGLGNGWTAEVIIHLLAHALKGIPKDEKIVVLSLYDGIGTGRYCLDRLGYRNIRYYAYEIDKYPIQVAMSNYPDIIQCGDAFAVREDGWTMEGCGTGIAARRPEPEPQPLEFIFTPIDMKAAQLSFY